MRSSWLVVASLGIGIIAACGSGGDNGSTGQNPTDGGASSSGNVFVDAGARPTFPTVLPAMGGYSLVPAFSVMQLDPLSSPIAMVWPKGTNQKPFVLNYPGYISQIVAGDARTVLDFKTSVALQGEGGALGMALHPKFNDATTPRPYVYVWYNSKAMPQNKQRLSRFTWQPASSTFDRASEQVLIEQVESSPYHNGGAIAFGADGFLYFGNGDDETDANNQSITGGLFAGVFRIDVDSVGGTTSHAPPRMPTGAVTGGYFIPNTNPFVGVANAREEFFALGMRNPYQFSFDKMNGDLWVGDVGETFEEEVDVLRAGDNGEYPFREGNSTRRAGAPALGTARPPRYAYSHADIGDLDAVLGGVVYRGTQFPELAGKYIFSDWISGRVWSLDSSVTPVKRTTLVDNKYHWQPYAIAQDNDGEIYILSSFDPTTAEPTYAHIYKLQRDTSAAGLPRLLSETRVFTDMAALTPHPALVPYEINSPLWSDGAEKKRWISVPPGQAIGNGDAGSPNWPVGTYAVKHFDLPAAVKPHGRTRRLETRLLIAGEKTIYGITYRWRADGSDADLVTDGIDETIVDDATMQTRTWHFPSFGQCWACHREENRVLGFIPRQLNKTVGGTNQLMALTAKGVFDATVPVPESQAIPSDTRASLEARATSYLAANCSPCHHPRDQFGGYWDASYGVPLANRALVYAGSHNNPMAEAFGLPVDAFLIEPNNPDGSLLYRRMTTNDPNLRMPPLARNVIDTAGAQLIADWIRSIPQ